MAEARLRKVGGSVMVAVPPAYLDALHMGVGQTVSIGIEGARLVLEPRRRPKYTLDELLSQCDFSLPAADEDREWLDVPPVGEELL